MSKVGRRVDADTADADVDAAAAEPAARGEPVVVPDRRVAVCGADARKPFTRRAPAGSTRTSDAKFAHAANVEAGMKLHLSSISALSIMQWLDEWVNGTTD